MSRVSIVDAAEKHLEVIVDDTQLSLAIGKKGQNVRLAAKLLGWKIDIKSEEEKRQEVEQQMSALVSPPTTPLEKVESLSEGLREKLVAAGVTTVEALADMTPEQLEAIPGIGPKTIERITLAVTEFFAQLEAAQAAEAAAQAEAEAKAQAEAEAAAAQAVPEAEVAGETPAVPAEAAETAPAAVAAPARASSGGEVAGEAPALPEEPKAAAGDGSEEPGKSPEES